MNLTESEKNALRGVSFPDPSTSNMSANTGELNYNGSAQNQNQSATVAIIGAVAAIAAGALASSASRKNTKETNATNKQMQEDVNKTNYKIAQEANYWNYRMMQEQNAWNLEQWNRQNAYNDPSAVVARMKAAGVNPAMQFGDATPAGSLQSASAQPASVAQMQAARNMRDDSWSMMYNSTMGAIDAYQQSRLNSANIDKTRNDIQIDNARNAREERFFATNLEYTKNMAKREDFLGEIARTQLKYEDASAKYRLSLLMGDVRKQAEERRTMQEQRFGYELQNRMAEIQLAYMPDMKEAELANFYKTGRQIEAQIGLINANAMLTNAQKETEIKKAIGIGIDNEMKGIDKEVKDRTKQAMINTAFENLYTLQDARFERPYNFYREHLGEGRRLGTSGVAHAVDIYQRQQYGRGNYYIPDAYTGRSRRKR